MGRLLLAIAHDEEEETVRKKTAADSPEKASRTPASGASEGGKDAKQGSGQGKGKARAEMEAHPVWSLLSSHPETVQRATALEKGQSPHCASR